MENKKVLIVDDEKNIRMTLKKALKGAGYKVKTAINGEDCLEKIEEEDFPVILLDKKLPGIDGLDVLRELNELNYHPKVIMITGYGNVESAVETMKLGAVDFLQKPFKPEEIIQLVDKVFKRISLEKEEKNLKSFSDLISLAKGEINKKNFTEAIKYLKKAISIDSEKPEPFNLMGVIYEIEGKHGEAMKMYRTALSLEPSYKPANENLQRASEMDIKKQGKLKDINLGDEKDDDL